MAETPTENKQVSKETWFHEPLTVFVFGASGDLAKKKTYPALFDLFCMGYLPSDIRMVGYARSKKNLDDFRKTIKEFLLKAHSDREEFCEEFLALCTYESGGYDDADAMAEVSSRVSDSVESKELENRVYYFALPPSAFATTAKSVKEGMIDKKSSEGFSRVVVEKPFGKDLKSAVELGEQMAEFFQEKDIYRIDHYLGKELVQNLMVLRFGNSITEAVWNRQHVSSVTITFKEDIGTEGRGGYFEDSGIIRDIMQNHLLQVLSLMAMEPPVRIKGKGHSTFIRNEKVKVLQAIKPFSPGNTVIGQYEGYRDDDTVANDSNRETYCCVVFYIDNPRWADVPFIMKAGKALDERTAEIRIQLKEPAGATGMFNNEVKIPKQEIVVRLQPNEAIYIKTNVKRPGLKTDVIQSELSLTYNKKYDMKGQNPDAYTRLLLDVLRGKQSTFVRQDELQAAWKIVDPLLKAIETDKTLKVIPYKYGSRGPKEADDLAKWAGFEYHAAYSENWRQKKQKL